MESKKNDIVFPLFFFCALACIAIAYAVVPHGVRYVSLSAIGERYTPLTHASDADTMNVHGARYRDIVDGAFIGGETDLYEYKGGLVFWPLLSAAVLAPFFWVTGSVGGGIIASDFVFPSLLFISFFLIINLLTGHRWFSFSASFLLLLFPQLPLLLPPSSIGELRTVLFNFIPLVNDTITPQLSYLRREAFIPGAPFFVLFFYFSYRALIRHKKTLPYMAVGGILYGLLFYLYFYFWVFATIFLCVFALFLSVARDVCLLRRVVAIGSIGVFVSIPFWLNQAALAHLPNYAELTARLGLEVGYGIRLFLWKTYLLFFALAGASMWLGKKRNAPVAGMFLAALSLTGILALNANMLTGFTPQSDHWATRVFLITNGIVFSVLVFYFYVYARERFMGSVRYERPLFLLSALIFMVLLSAGVLYFQVVDARANAEKFSIEPPLSEAYEWMNRNTSQDSVIVSPSFETNTDIVVYTHNRIFLPRAQTTLAPTKEILERLYLTYALFGINPVTLYDTLGTERQVFNLFTASYASKALDAYLRPERHSHFALPEMERILITSDYAQFVLPEKIPYKADYIFIGPKEKSMRINEENFLFYKKLFDENGVTIYDARANP